MRRDNLHKWIFCEGADDKLYLSTMLKKYYNVHIVPLGGCTNVIKLYRILIGFLTERSESASPNALFLIDTDRNRVPIQSVTMFNGSNPPVLLRRLQIDNNEIKLLDPSNGGTYDQTEIEDCLDPYLYWNSLTSTIKSSGSTALKKIIKKFELDKDAKRSVLRGDESCIRPTDLKFLVKKEDIIDFAEDDNNKFKIACMYAELCKNKAIEHPLADLIVKRLDIKSGELL